MKISLATNYDDNLIDQIKDYPVYEIYGKLKHDYIGTEHLLLGILTEVRPEQPQNTLFPMLVTPLGILIAVKPVQQ